MPIHDLISAFNDRFQRERNLSKGPLTYKQGNVEGQFADINFTTRFEPVRITHNPRSIQGLDAHLDVYQTSSRIQEGAADLFFQAEAGQLVNLDRLCRTVHMLNYLAKVQQYNYLLLPVHPRHVLSIKRDHGAYFEDILFQCGLEPRRVVISVLVAPSQGHQITSLLDGLRNYQSRSYGTAIKFDHNATQPFLERYCIEFIYRMTPDFVRFEADFLTSLVYAEKDLRTLHALFNAMRSMDTQILIDGIKDQRAAQLAQILQADLVKGDYYDDEALHHAPPRSHLHDPAAPAFA